MQKNIKILIWIIGIVLFSLNIYAETQTPYPTGPYNQSAFQLIDLFNKTAFGDNAIVPDMAWTVGGGTPTIVQENAYIDVLNEYFYITIPNKAQSIASAYFLVNVSTGDIEIGIRGSGSCSSIQFLTTNNAVKFETTTTVNNLWIANERLAVNYTYWD